MNTDQTRMRTARSATEGPSVFVLFFNPCSIRVHPWLASLRAVRSGSPLRVDHGAEDVNVRVAGIDGFEQQQPVARRLALLAGQRQVDLGDRQRVELRDV